MSTHLVCRIHYSPRPQSPQSHCQTGPSTVSSATVLPKEKAAVFQDIARILKPGGRVAANDILARKQLPGEIVNDMALYVGCVAGASQIADYEEYL